MFDIITFGSATQDIIVSPRHLTVLDYGKKNSQEGICFPVGGKIDIEKMDFYSGGGGTNTAATFALQGFKTAFYGATGNDVSGQEIINELKSLKVDTGFVVKKNEKLTNHSIVILNGSLDRTILTYRGASELLDKNEIRWNKLKTKWIYLAPLSGLLCDTFEEIVNFAAENKIKIAANPGIAQLSLPPIEKILKKVDVLFLNKEEASFLTKISITDENAIFKKIDELCAGVVVMTKGGDGVIVSDKKYLYSAVPPVERKVVDTTGAGDAFASGFLSEYMRNSNIEKSIQLGMANSVANLREVGAKTGLLKRGQEFEGVKVNKQL